MKEERKFKKRSGLGRGLSAILEDAYETKEDSNNKNSSGGTINEIEISKIVSNPFQPRTDFDENALNELAESIKVHGIIQPVTVREDKNNTFQLISGERRLIASKKAKIKKIPAYIRKVNDEQMLEMALIENIQRENLNAIEIALSFQRLMTECNLNQEEVSDKVGKKRSTVTNYIRLLKLPPTIQTGVRDGQISMGHARALITVESSILQLELYKQILQNGLSVRNAETLVQKAAVSLNKKEQKNHQESKPQDIVTLESDLSLFFGTKISIDANKQYKGDIKIPFLSLGDLNRMLEIIDFRK